MLGILAFLITVLFLAAPNLAKSQDFEAGMKAYNAGGYQSALSEFSMLANQQNDANSQFQIALMYDLGLGVAMDTHKAFKWYKRAAENELAAAQQEMGWSYVKGERVPKDLVQAARWFKLAAKQGRVGSQVLLAAAYRTGAGVLQNFVTAHMWYNIAGANGGSYAAGSREELEKLMLPQDISEAQRRAEVCLASNYTDCD